MSNSQIIRLEHPDNNDSPFEITLVNPNEGVTWSGYTWRFKNYWHCFEVWQLAGTSVIAFHKRENYCEPS